MRKTLVVAVMPRRLVRVVPTPPVEDTKEAAEKATARLTPGE
jgi:hypothetical protein